MYNIPNGDEIITVELTVKEAIALTGIRFNQQPKLVAGARRKLKRELDRKFEVQDTLPYQALEM